MEAHLQNLISAVARDCREALSHDGEYVQHDILATLWDAELTQENIDSVPSFHEAGLTVAQVKTGVYILKQIHVQMNTDLPAMTMLANL